MIRAGAGAVFTTASDGDCRNDPAARARLGIPVPWATVDQVHGARVRRVADPGDHGPADGLVTDVGDLPVAVFTADCLGIVLRGPGAVASVHAGWRGLAGGVVQAAVAEIGEVTAAFIGPHIRSCCFEVGPEVAARFPGHVTTTTWGTTSVDLAAATAAVLPVDPVDVQVCTRCGDDTFSHRRDGTDERLAAVGWIP